MTDSKILMKSMLQVGTLLHGGKYRIEKYLSSGGFGNTYIATDTTFDNEIVVVKEFFIRGINERDSNSLSISVSNETNKNQFEEQKEKFWREAKRLRLLKHPNIVGVHDRFEENGTAYYVMDFIDGKSLSEILKKEQCAYTEEQALSIIEKVVDALGVVHAQQMYHMDIKPGNIMLDKDGNAKLIDFGASKQVVAGKNSAISVSTSGFCYTPGYAPSEQVNQLGKNIGPWTDFYAVGGTLYNLLTLQSPPSMSDILEDEEDAFDFPDEISEHTRKLVVWMMRPQRAMRPQSAPELLAVIRGAEVPSKKKKIAEPVTAETKIVLSPKATSAADTTETSKDSGKKPVVVKPAEGKGGKGKNQPNKVAVKGKDGDAAKGKAPAQSKQETAEEETGKKRIGVFVAAAVVALLLVFGGFKFFGGDDNETPAEQPTTALADSLRADSIAKADSAEHQAEADAAAALAARQDSIQKAEQLAEQQRIQAEQERLRQQQAAQRAAAQQQTATRYTTPRNTRGSSTRNSGRSGGSTSSTPSKPTTPSKRAERAAVID